MIYQEEEDGNFTHNGKKYRLNSVFQVVHDYPVQEVPVSELEWVLEYSYEVIDGVKKCHSCRKGPDTWHAERVANADLNIPIIYTKSGDKLVVLDGLHRLQKAVDLKLETILGKEIKEEELEKCLRK